MSNSSIPPAHLSSLPLSYADVVEDVAPAVVTVHTLFRQLFGG